MASKTQRLFIVYTIINFVSYVAAQDTKNITVTVPAGASYDKESNVLCTPISSFQILVFFFANYLSHAATIRTYPGEKSWSIWIVVIVALLFPYSGLARGMSAIRRHAITKGPLFGGSDLQMAARAQALCVVCRRQGWKPCMAKKALSGLSMYRKVTIVEYYPGDGEVSAHTSETIHYDKSFSLVERDAEHPYHNAFLTVDYESSGVSHFFGDRAIHGCHRLPSVPPESYGFAILPEDAKVEAINTERSSSGTRNDEFAIPSTIDASSAVVAIVQIGFASLTLYKTRGPQVSYFGYSAFGLTVLPYLIMSIVNLIGNILTPKYPALFVVWSLEMDEAEAHGGHFEGVVGGLSNDISCDISATVDETGEILALSRLPKGVSIVQKHQPTPGHNYSHPQPPVIAEKHLFRVMEFEEEPSDGIGISIPSSSAFRLRHVAKKSAVFWDIATTLGMLVAIITPFAVNGGLTSFHEGNSTHAQRAWIMTWQVFGIIIGLVMFLVSEKVLTRSLDEKWQNIVGFSLLFGVPSVGGFVVAGQMLKNFGHCTEIGQ